MKQKNSFHRPVKSLGQNFLTDKRSVERIISSCQISPTDTILEIGPGQGALTKYFIPHGAKIIGLEKDKNLAALLKENFPDENLQIINADILQYDFSQLPQPLKVIGNIPYYISTPIIEKLIENKDKISDIFLTVQLEFGERLVAKPHSKTYGSLSLFAQYHFEVKILFKIKAGCFYPKPKVDSCFIHLKPIFRKVKIPESQLFNFIQTAFQQRRKTLGNTLKNLIAPEKLNQFLEKLELSKNVRPENVDLNQFIALAEMWKNERRD